MGSRWLYISWLSAIAAIVSSAALAQTQRIVLREHLGHTWREELVGCPMQSDSDKCRSRGLRLVDEAGGNARAVDRSADARGCTVTSKSAEART